MLSPEEVCLEEMSSPRLPLGNNIRLKTRGFEQTERLVNTRNTCQVKIPDVLCECAHVALGTHSCRLSVSQTVLPPCITDGTPETHFASN